MFFSRRVFSGSHFQKGATLLEASVALPFFIIFLIFSFEFLKLCYYVVMSQYVVASGARIVSVSGPNLTSSARCNVSGTTRLSRVKCEVEEASQNLMFPIDLANHLYVCTESQGFYGCGASSGSSPLIPVEHVTAGAPGEIFALRLQIPVPLFWGTLEIPIQAISVGRNEPY